MDESFEYEAEYLNDSTQEYYNTVEEESFKIVDYSNQVSPNRNLIIEKPKKKIKQKKTTRDLLLNAEEKDAFDEALLTLVFDRPPLFNYCLPIEERSPGIINKLWLEIVEELTPKFGSLLTANMLKDRFKYHRDLYTRFKTGTEKIPSGSGASQKLMPKHFDKLRHLDSVMAKRRQITNLHSSEPSTSSTTNSEYIPPQKKSNTSFNLSNRHSSGISSRPNSALSGENSSESVDVSGSIDKLVGAVQLSALQRNEKRFNDRAQNFGEQVAWFMRDLNNTDFYAATTYINKYFYELSKKQ